MLCLTGDTNTVKFYDGSTLAATVSTFVSQGPELVSFDCPALTANKKYTFVVERTDTNGKTLVTKAKPVTVKAAAPAPTPSEPTLTEAWTLEHTEEGDKDKAYGDADLEVIGTNLQGASVNMRFEGISGAPYDEAVPADKLTIRADGTGFDVDGTWLVANVLAVMNSDDTFQIHAETSAGTADLVVTNKYEG